MLIVNGSEFGDVIYVLSDLVGLVILEIVVTFFAHICIVELWVVLLVAETCLPRGAMLLHELWHHRLFMFVYVGRYFLCWDVFFVNI